MIIVPSLDWILRSRAEIEEIEVEGGEKAFEEVDLSVLMGGERSTESASSSAFTLTFALISFMVPSLISSFIHLQVLTKDSVTVSVDAVVYYRVSNATISVANVENAHHSTRLLAQTTLRNILGTKNLHEILSDRESISGSMQVRSNDTMREVHPKLESL